MRTLLLSLLAVTLTACTASTVSEAPSYDFDQQGTLTRNTPGLTPGVWYLSYQEGSTPEMTMRLSFEDTVCLQGASSGPCERSVFQNELSVRVRGMRENEGVAVKEMTVLGE